MAATMTREGNLTYVSFPIEKTETTPDGDLIVYGKATDGTVDSDEQIVDPEWSAKALAEWLDSGGNIRVQHNPQRDPAGKGISVEYGADGHYVKSLIVEPVAKRLVEKGVLRAYSVGISRPRIERDPTGKARGGVIKGGPDTEICEISLVDRPANKNCGIELVKSDKQGRATWVGKVFGSSDLATKSEGEEVVTVDLPKDASISFKPSDLAKLLDYKSRLVEKRQMDPDVGGGVDRDKIPSEDFAGRDRSFPIVTPGDVSDAASSIGRAGPDNYNSDKLKENIIRIARRKGDAYVSELPESWKKELNISSNKSSNQKPGTDFEFSRKDDDHDEEDAKPMTASHDDQDSDEDEDVEKGKPFPGAAEAFNDKKPGKKNKGKKKPQRDAAMAEAEATEAFKGNKMPCKGCKAMISPKHSFCPKCGVSAVGEPPVKKGKPTPDEGVVGSAARDVKPVPEHREPDGEAVEALEHDAKLPTDPDREVMASMRHKSVGAPSSLGVLHDLLCPAFSPDDVAKCFPTASVSGLDVAEWQSKAFDSVTSATLEEAAKMSQLWQHAITLKGTDPEVIGELRDEAFKSFKDANPGPGTFPQPTELSPTKFKRPYISAGHAAPSPGQHGPNTAHVPTSDMAASGFHREHLDAGHAADSPSNKSDAAILPAPRVTGKPERTYYRNTQRDAARSAMQAMHDHIAHTFPDLCAMSDAGHGGTPPAGARPVPTPAGAKKSKKVEKAEWVGKLTVDPEVIKTAVVEATADLTAQVTEITKALKAEQKRNRKLQKAVDALQDLPDPSTAPFKGVAQNAFKMGGSPAGVRTVAEHAERTQLMMMRELEDQFRTSPDPAQREAAWSALVKMRGLPNV